MGVESRAVMPGVPMSEDLPDLLRTTYGNLESSNWWKSHGLDGVVLYSWGHPKFLAVAWAIRNAGLKLVLNQDSSGLVSPLAGFTAWFREQILLSGVEVSCLNLPNAMARIASGMTRGLIWTDPMRSKHLHAGDVIAAVSPSAANHYRQLCRIYGGEALASRVRFIPHPVSSCFFRSGIAKEFRIIAVGRWDDEVQKRPERLTEVIERLAVMDPSIMFDIVGFPAKRIRNWHEGLAHGHKDRVTIHGLVDPENLATIMNRAIISYCPSAYESFHIASAEALCCGASVVGGCSPSLPTFSWFTSGGSGRLARSDSPRAHAEALFDEIASWNLGERSAEHISSTWVARLHAIKVAREILCCTSSLS
jgi:hypothetical protein